MPDYGLQTDSVSDNYCDRSAMSDQITVPDRDLPAVSGAFVPLLNAVTGVPG
jgi:hypothetical protein